MHTALIQHMPPCLFIWPHDARNIESKSNKTRKKEATGLGI